MAKATPVTRHKVTGSERRRPRPSFATREKLTIASVTREARAMGPVDLFAMVLALAVLIGASTTSGPGCRRRSACCSARWCSLCSSSPGITCCTCTSCGGFAARSARVKSSDGLVARAPEAFTRTFPRSRRRAGSPWCQRAWRGCPVWPARRAYSGQARRFPRSECRSS